MKVSIREVTKKELPQVLNDDALWTDRFLVASKHRLYAHFQNPNAQEDDVILLLSYVNDVLVGYLGCYIDIISIEDHSDKIAWLSTWWLHKDAAGKGIGGRMLRAMYEIHDGKIGISQFTPSAKRVYDKSGYFVTLKKLQGCKIDIRFNLQNLLPLFYSRFRSVRGMLSVLDGVLNLIVNLKLKVIRRIYSSKIRDVKIDYLSYVDRRTAKFIDKFQQNALCKRNPEFFNYIKVHKWIEEAPLIDLVADKKRYFFSDYNRRFNIYLLRVISGDNIVSFCTMLRKDEELKVLQIYYEAEYVAHVARLVVLHGIELGISTIITYDAAISSYFKKNGLARIRYKKKERESIISKIYGINDFGNYNFQYGDGDCSFA